MSVISPAIPGIGSPWERSFCQGLSPLREIIYHRPPASLMLTAMRSSKILGYQMAVIFPSIPGMDSPWERSFCQGLSPLREIIYSRPPALMQTAMRSSKILGYQMSVIFPAIPGIDSPWERIFQFSFEE